MHNELYRTLPVPASTPEVASWLRPAGVVLAGTVLLAVTAHLSVPLWFTPVPLSLEPFGVLLLGLLLAPRLALATTGAYLLEGALGLPVFAPSPLSGLAHLLGPTGGYLLAAPAAALLIAWLYRRTGRGVGSAMLAAAAGDLLILAGGALWLTAAGHRSLGAALSLGVLAFLPGDALKVIAAGSAAALWTRLRRRTS